MLIEKKGLRKRKKMTEKTKKMTEASASVCLILATALLSLSYLLSLDKAVAILRHLLNKLTLG